MEKLIKWINGKIEQTIQLWYCWIGAMCGIEILNLTLVRKYAPFWGDIVISILLLVIVVCYISVFYKYMYGKYKNYLETNKSEILQQLEIFEKRIEELSEDAKKDVEAKYTELSLKAAAYNVELKTEIDVQSKSTNANIQDNLHILQNEIKEVFNKDVEGFAKIEATVAETSDKANKTLDEHFDRVRSNVTEKQNELNVNINRVVGDLSAELKVASQEIVNTSNQSKKDVIDETYRVSTDRHHKEMELINKVFNQVSESYEGVITQLDKAENSISGNIAREAFDISSNLVRIEDVIKEEHFDSQKQIDEVTDKVVENTNSIVNSNHETLSEQLKEIAESVAIQLSNGNNELIEKAAQNKSDLIENAKQSNDSLVEEINSVFSKTESKIDENTAMITESIETTKETIDSLIVAKQSEVLTTLETLHKENASNLKALFEITNSGVEVGIKELASKVDDSTSSVNKTMADEISTVKNNQSDIRQLINDFIASEKEFQNTMGQATEQFQNQIELLQKEVINEIVKSVNDACETQTTDSNSRNEVIDGKFNNVYQQITTLTETLSNRTDKLDASVAKTLSIAKAIEESGTKKNDSLFGMLYKMLETDKEVALSTEKLGVKQEETASKISNLETQMATLNDLVKMLKNVASHPEKKEKESVITKKEPNRTEKIHDVENKMTVFNTFNNDILQHSEMQQSGKKVFSADYNSKGSILLSKNYDKQGEVIMENSYHSNGQVKERKEKVKENGIKVTKITNFDQSGKKLS